MSVYLRFTMMLILLLTMVLTSSSTFQLMKPMFRSSFSALANRRRGYPPTALSNAFHYSRTSEYQSTRPVNTPSRSSGVFQRRPSSACFSTLNDNPSEQNVLLDANNVADDKVQKENNDDAHENHSMPSSTMMPECTWNSSSVKETLRVKKRNNNLRFRQHVNPLARKYQVPTLLSSDQWPRNVFKDCSGSKPLHLDIGCGKGGFLLDLAAHEGGRSEAHIDETHSSQSQLSSTTDDFPYNYLGLEVRPPVAQLAKDRVGVHNLTGVVEFLGCNANVDLDRLLRLYHEASFTTSTTTSNNADDIVVNGAADTQPLQDRLLLERVTIQFPDPHFKTQHAKRRVVTDALVDTLARYMPPETGVVFLQSDVLVVLESMRQVFGNASTYFVDSAPPTEYLSDNWLRIPTEREVSVLKRDLPVYRCLFYRTSAIHPDSYSKIE